MQSKFDDTSNVSSIYNLNGVRTGPANQKYELKVPSRRDVCRRYRTWQMAQEDKNLKSRIMSLECISSVSDKPEDLPMSLRSYEARLHKRANEFQKDMQALKFH